MFIWTALGNLEATFSFSTSISTTFDNVEAILWIWLFAKNFKKVNYNLRTKWHFWASNKIIWKVSAFSKSSSIYSPFSEEENKEVEEDLKSRKDY